MVRWMAVLVTLGLAAGSADAQVFKPKAKKASTSEKKPAKKKAASETTTAPKKRVTTKPKKGGAKTEKVAKGPDADFIRIWDDEDSE
jgi:hypothetical protein